MATPSILESQQSVQAAAARRPAAGCWKLASGKALSLIPRKSGVFEVAQGRVWLTTRDAQDHVLEAGHSLRLEAGQHIVLEAWNPPGDVAEPVAFRWDVVVSAPAAAADWEQGVALPLKDLLRAVAEALTAGVRLASGLARFAFHRLALQWLGRAV